MEHEHEPYRGAAGEFEIKTSGMPQALCRHCNEIYLCDLDGNPLSLAEASALFFGDVER